MPCFEEQRSISALGKLSVVPSIRECHVETPEGALLIQQADILDLSHSGGLLRRHSVEVIPRGHHRSVLVLRVGEDQHRINVLLHPLEHSPWIMFSRLA